MSQEQVLKTLLGLGLSRLDSQVYIYLAKKGPKKGQDLSKALKVQKQQLYRSLKILQSKGIVNATLEHPARFNAVSFEKVVDIFVKAKMAEAQRIQENKDEILANWQAVAIGEANESTAKFNVIEGRGPIYSKILEMMHEAENQLSTITTVAGLVRVDQFGLFDVGIENQIRPKIRFRALTEISEQNTGITKELLKGLAKAKINFEGRTPDLTLKLPQMVIKDEQEILFFITPSTADSASEQEDVCLWTNCKSLVQAFTGVFEDFWHNSTSINAKITEIETGKPAPRTQIIDDAETARKKYNDTLQAAEKEVTIITSTQGLIETWKNKPLLDEWGRKGVFVNIMAPITSENMEAAQQLLRSYQVRHVPVGYLGTTIVDGKHLFQFKNAPIDQQTLDPKPSFENTFYTNDIGYVEKTRIMLNDVWKNAQTPSTLTLDAINRISAPDAASDYFDPLTITIEKVQGPTVTRNKPILQITEKDVLDKIMYPAKYHTENHSNIVTTYGTCAQAVIHPPSHFELPDLLFHYFHFERQSTFGAEDMMIIHEWLNSPMGYFYVPTTFITDNAKSVDFWKRFLAGIPAGQNIKLVKKDEFQVHVHGNTALAAWTIPISIPPHNLPPSCILAEGIGKLRPGTHTILTPSGYREKATYNSGDAFITFLHPASKYSGPGTDGVFGRDNIMEIYPP